MSFPSLNLRPQAKWAAPVIFVTGCLSTALNFPLSTLAAATISWATIYVVCWKLSQKNNVGRFAHASINGRKRLVLAGCILGQAVCERMSSNEPPNSVLAWTKACVPVTFLLLRKVDVGGLWSTESPIAGRRKLIVVLTIAALLSTASASIKTPFVLGISVIGYSALGYSYIEEIISELSDSGSNEELLSNMIPIGKELGLYLMLAFGISAIAFEANMGERFIENGPILYSTNWNTRTLTQLLSVGFLGALRWMMVPLLVSQAPMISMPFLDLSIALIVALAVNFSFAKLLCLLMAIVAMTVFLAQGKSGGQKAHLNLLFLSLAIFISITCVDLIYTHGYRSESIGITHNLAPSPTILSKGQHPITQLIKEAEERYTSMQNNQSKTLAQAVKEYQRRYKMNPPPHFDKWYEFAKERNVEVIDEYDTIYDSIKPFWGMPPDLVRKRAANSMGFKDEGVMKNNKFVHAYIRNGVVKISGQGPDWQKDATGKMIDRFAQWLPDMNLPFNIHDEPRVVVAHDMLAQHLKKADQAILSSNKPNPQGRFTIGKEGMISEYPQTDFNVFAHQGIWTHAIMSCAPDSPVRSIERVPDRTDKFLMQPLGFVANKTAQSDICLSPGMETSFGLFDRPNAFNVVQRLYPVFSQSKVSTFGDILYPSPWYWSGKVKYNEADDMPWENKTSALYWRGSTTGGYSRNGGWKRQHRQRVVSNLEADDTATILHKEKQVDGIWTTKKIPRKDLRALFDVHFSGVGQCDPSDCSQQREHFHVAEPAKQHDAWKSKYLLDVDGNAFSGRYHAFLESRSTVFKLAIFREWHDEWLHPWVHYVPVSLNVEEVAEIMRFFVHEEGGDAVAKRIADEGRRWAKKVLRNEAMDVWFFRLLLEYGRVIDDERDTIGFTL